MREAFKNQDLTNNLIGKSPFAPKPSNDPTVDTHLLVGALHAKPNKIQRSKKITISQKSAPPKI